MTTATAPARPVAPTISLGTRLAGFSHLLRLAWRRDRILIPSSVLGLVVLAVGSAQATLALYPTDESASDRAGRRAEQPVGHRPLRPGRRRTPPTRSRCSRR